MNTIRPLRTWSCTPPRAPHHACAQPLRCSQGGLHEALSSSAGLHGDTDSRRQHVTLHVLVITNGHIALWLVCCVVLAPHPSRVRNLLKGVCGNVKRDAWQKKSMRLRRCWYPSKSIAQSSLTTSTSTTPSSVAAAPSRVKTPEADSSDDIVAPQLKHWPRWPLIT